MFLRRMLGCVGCLLALCAAPLSADARPAVAIARVSDGAVTEAIVVAARGAARRLERPSCAAVLDVFRAADGRTLREVVTAQAWSVEDVAARVIFRDGAASAVCRERGIAAFTGAGSRVVFVCGRRFAAVDRTQAELTLVHEFLHTLGLEERPPLPAEIDRAVHRACA